MNSFHSGRREEPFDVIHTLLMRQIQLQHCLRRGAWLSTQKKPRELVGYPLGCRFLPSLLQLHLLSVPQR